MVERREYKIVDRYTWEHINQAEKMNWPMNEDEKGWRVEQVIAKPVTHIEYEYVLVKINGNPGTGSSGE